MSYVEASEVLLVAGITSTEVPESQVDLMISMAEDEVDRLTNTTYWVVEESATADSATDDTLTDSDAFSTNSYDGFTVWIYSGTGSGQARLIESNDKDTLTVDRDWETNPDDTSKYRIIYSSTIPYVEQELRDGDDTDEIFLNQYPLQILESVSIDSVDVTPSTMFLYKKQGRVLLSADSEQQYWKSKKAQLNDLAYWYGVYPLPGLVKSYTLTIAALRVLQVQMGGTHNVPSTYSLPEGSVSIGQAYVNIRGTWDVLQKNKAVMEERLIKYFSIA